MCFMTLLCFLTAKARDMGDKLIDVDANIDVIRLSFGELGQAKTFFVIDGFCSG